MTDESVTPNPASRVFCSAGWAGWLGLAAALAGPNIFNQSIDMSNDKTYFKHAQSFIDQIRFC